VFTFIPDSQKDMVMNLIGTAIFILLARAARGRVSKILATGQTQTAVQ
jgi:hypothetical protein